jgi:PAS domain S-box-containing protein
MVDDHPAKLLSYEAVLSGLGVECVRAHSGLEALEKILKGGEFAVILLDVNMPGMDGFEVARLMREHPRLEKTPIIFITAVHGSDVDRLRGYEVGAIDYISVPVAPEILRTKVSILVELYQRKSELQEINRALAEARGQMLEQHARALAVHQSEREAIQAEHAAIFEHPGTVITVLETERDEQGIVQDWVCRNANSTALKYFGASREDVIGRHLARLVPERAAREMEVFNRALQSGEPVRYESVWCGTDLLVTVFRIGPNRVVSSGVDITDRKNAEAALRNSERRYRALIENAPVAVSHNAMDGRFEYVNQAFCDLLGYTAEELCSRTWQDVTHPDDISVDRSLGGDVIAKRATHYTLEKRYVRKDGQHVWVSLFGNFVFNDGGDPVQGVAVVVDITERKRAEQALRESEQRLLLAKRAAQLGTHDFDVLSGSIKWDERTCELWGVPPHTHVNYEVFLHGLHPEDRARAQAALEQAFDPQGDGRYFCVYRVINRVDHTTRWIEASGQALFQERRAVRLVGTVQDVTDRTLASERLRESEARIREIANNIDQFAWTCNELGFATWYNDRWYDYTGTTPEEMQGEGWQKVIDPEHLPRLLKTARDCMSRGLPWEDTYPIRGKDGTFRWFLSRAVPIRDETGRVKRWFGTNTDVTELRKLQEALRAADRRKDEFLAMLSHELRNPVAPIASAAEALAQLVPDQQQRSLVEIVKRQASTLSRLLDDLLDVARITQGRIQLHREVISIDTCLALAIETAQPLIQEKSHTLRMTSPGHPLYVNADRIRLAQCLANLLANAAKYTESGGEIQVHSWTDGADAVIEVTDTGAGISPTFLPHIFDLFAQGERTLDRSLGGLGVGLSVCKQLIEMQGGSVSARSDGLGHGATFVLRLPRSAYAPKPIAPEEDANPQSLRILIVDDNEDAADALAMILKLEGHEIRTAYSAEFALAELPAFLPHVALLDIGLPGMTGYELARRMRAAAGGSSLRLIAVSGYGQAEDRARSHAAGFDAHLVKPVLIDDLAPLLMGGRKR